VAARSEGRQAGSTGGSAAEQQQRQRASARLKVGSWGEEDAEGGDYLFLSRGVVNYWAKGLGKARQACKGAGLEVMLFFCCKVICVLNSN